MDDTRPRDASTAWVSIGPHRFAEYERHCEWQPHGVVALPHAEELVKRLLAYQERTGKVALIVDGRELAPLSAEVRSFYVQAVNRGLNYMPIVVYGASLLAKVTQTLALRAGQIIHQLHIELRHFETRQEAVAYIQKRLNIHLRESLS